VTRKLSAIIGILLVGALAIACAPASTPTPPDETEQAPEEEEEEAAPPAAADEEAFTWRMQSPYPEAFPYHQDMVAMCNRITEMSGGRMQFETFASGGIVPAYEELDATVSGTLDAHCGGLSEHRDKFGPVVDLLCQYPGGPTVLQLLAWFYEGDQAGLQFERELYSDLNVHVIGPSTTAGPEDEMWSNRKITSIEDYKGLKIRTYGEWGNVLASFGASVVTMSGSELYPAMERKVIDALEYSTPANDMTMHFYEIADYLHYPGIHSPGVTGSHMWVNQDRWNELPDDLKHIVEYAAQHQAYKGYYTDLYKSGEALQFYEDYGVELVKLPDEVQKAIIDKTDEIWAETSAEDAFFGEVLASQKAVIEQLGASTLMEPNVVAIRAMD